MDAEKLLHDSQDQYYSDSAIRERCLRMATDIHVAVMSSKRRYGPSLGYVDDDAEDLFRYVKTGPKSIPPEKSEE